MRTSSYIAGPVSTADVFALEPFESRAVKVSMTLSEIRQLIINKFNDTENPGESHRVDIYTSGMNYTIITNEAGEAVDVTFDHRLPYETNRKYTVALSDYIYKMYKFEKPSVETTSPPLTTIFIDYLRTNSPVSPDNRPRASVRVR
jgi:2',3'-cyclic-nucleotide 2'-phosphodiesterase (5'-nucleotidase family)